MHWLTKVDDGGQAGSENSDSDSATNIAQRGAGHLLARVMVNRLWQHHFGEGLVRTPNDFGQQGERPTHRELLDWLARQLIAGGWHLKPLHRMMLISAVYRQGTTWNPAAAKIDPDNRLLCAGGRSVSRPKHCAMPCWP